MRNGHRFIGVGVYTVPEVARLANVPAPSVRRWVQGYSYVRQGVRRELPPVVGHSLDSIDGRVALTFRDMQELRCLHVFRRHGVSWHTLRLAHHAAQKRLGDRHPFSTGHFVTDGRSILTDVIRQSRRGDPILLEEALEDILRRQLAFKRVIARFVRGLEFENGRVVRWYPLRDRRVILDPARSFGQPIVEEGVPTLVLYRAYLVEASYDLVARWFGVDHRSIRAAVDFEARLSAA